MSACSEASSLFRFVKKKFGVSISFSVEKLNEINILKLITY